MKINAKNYPKTIVYRKWMIVAAGFVMVLMVILLMYNLSRQNTQKKEMESSAAQNEHKSTKLASAKDTAWINSAHIDKSSFMQLTPTVDTGADLPVVAVNTKSNPSSLPQSTSVNTNTDKSISEDYQKQQENKEKAMMTPINANQLVAQGDGRDTSSLSVNMAKSTQSAVISNGSSSDDPNAQISKEAFVDKAKNSEEGIYLDKSVMTPRSPYELQAGTIIPGILITGINSDLPGQIVGQIRQNVYDSITGDHVLVPQGAKVVGLYDSKVTYGQERVLVVWKRIIFPNGGSIDLSGMPGVDLSGYAGFEDKVNNHFGRIFGSVLLLSTMSAGAQLSQPNNNNSYYDNDYPSVGQTMAQSLGTNLSDFGTKLAEKNLNIQPTLMIRPGYLFNISVTKDIVFPGPYHEES